MAFVRFVRAEDVNAGAPFPPYVVNMDQVSDFTVATYGGVYVLKFNQGGGQVFEDVYLAPAVNGSAAEQATNNDLLAELAYRLKEHVTFLEDPIWTP